MRQCLGHTGQWFTTEAKAKIEMVTILFIFANNFLLKTNETDILAAGNGQNKKEKGWTGLGSFRQETQVVGRD